jgi:hypothetical protein
VAVNALAANRLVTIFLMAAAVANALYGRQKQMQKYWISYLNVGTANLLLPAFQA